MNRDDFRERTKLQIAQRVGYRCSKPDCQRQTIGAATTGDGVVNVGVAAHITAAAAGGPRYDAVLTPEERRGQKNGIWLCQTHAKAIDSDGSFTVEMLLGWKQKAEAEALPDVFGPQTVSGVPGSKAPDLEADGKLATATAKLLAAATADLQAFKRLPGWPSHAVPLSLRLLADGAVRPFDVDRLVTALDAYPSITVIAPPGTGKTTTLLQMASAVLTQRSHPAVFVPLSEWSSQPSSLLASVVSRKAFAGIQEEEFKLLADAGRLVLFLDGWNELDLASRRRATSELQALRRDYPDLGVVISTRSRDLDVPIAGPVVEIEPLSYEHQLEIARALNRTSGEAILDHAWRTPGVRELVGIPLYLTVLLDGKLGDSFPSTKEAVLRRFVSEHEKLPGRADALQAIALGFHADFLQSLAVEATQAANTTIADTAARTVIRRVEDRLAAEGQITIAPQPGDILAVLVSHHSLVRTGGDAAGVYFQHQQFQEWHASFEAERLMRSALAGDEAAHLMLRADILNLPVWEEAVLFACERASRGGQGGVDAVSGTILETLGIDPIFAAEMIYRSDEAVWAKIGKQVIDFVGRWHRADTVDRAAAFMITSGRPEFGSLIWPLVAHPNSQVHLNALRAGRRFRPTVLGPDVGAQLRPLSQELRGHILGEIAHRSGMDGIELAAELAKADPSSEVKNRVIQSLLFRRAGRLVPEILSTAPDEVWRYLARHGDAADIHDPQVIARLNEIRMQSATAETSPLGKLGYWARMAPETVELTNISQVIEDPDFPVKDQRAGSILVQLHRRFPAEVNTGLVRRLEAGAEIPFRTEELLQTSNVMIDDGPLVELVLDPATSGMLAGPAAKIIGPRTVAKLIDAFLAMAVEIRAAGRVVSEAMRNRYHALKDRIRETPQSAFVEAILARASAKEPEVISDLAKLLALHGGDQHQQPLVLAEGEASALVQTLERWSDLMCADGRATRLHMAYVAEAMSRVPSPMLISSLEQLLTQDLTLWRQAREAFTAQGNRRDVPAEVHTSWVLQYRRSFAAIGGESVASRMVTFLADPDFAVDAAWVLKDIWDKENRPPAKDGLIGWADFAGVKERRLERSRRPAVAPHPYAEAVFAAIGLLLASPNDRHAHGRALQLAGVAFSLPHADHTDMLEALSDLPGCRAEQLNLLTLLVLAGDVVSADRVLKGLAQLFEDAKTQSWLLDESRGELQGWIDLMPFSDRPLATIEALNFLPDADQRPPWRMRRLLEALGNAPTEEAEQILAHLARENAAFLGEYEWLHALERRETVSAGRLLMEVLTIDYEGNRRSNLDVWNYSKALAHIVAKHPELRSELHDKYAQCSSALGRAVFEETIAEIADAESVLALVRGYAASEQLFDGTLNKAIERVALGQQPVAGWSGAYEIFSVPVPGLRKELFALTVNDDPEAMLAASCLNLIDELRDEHGHVDGEARHPDIETNLPWPKAASL